MPDQDRATGRAEAARERDAYDWLVGYCEQVARDGIMPDREWFTETAALVRQFKTALTEAEAREQARDDTPKRPDDWFNQVCAALGLFDGARPVSPQRVLWDEVLPTIEALKTNNPEAGAMVREQERVYELWRDALAKIVHANRRADALQRERDTLQGQLREHEKRLGLLGSTDTGNSRS